MVTSSLSAAAPNQAPVAWPLRELLFRCALCALAVACCYLFSWHWLRQLTCTANLVADAWFGVHLERLSPDTVRWGGGLYYYAIACAYADVWCGALPFLWGLRSTLARNLRTIAAFSAALFVFNIARLTFSDVLVAHGAPWSIGHEFVSGVAYFLIWSWLTRRQAPWKHTPALRFEKV